MGGEETASAAILEPLKIVVGQRLSYRQTGEPRGQRQFRSDGRDEPPLDGDAGREFNALNLYRLTKQFSVFQGKRGTKDHTTEGE
jgi:hypothetical protein